MTPEIFPQPFESRPLTLLLFFIVTFSLKLLVFFSAPDPVVFYKYLFFAEQISQGSDISERILDLCPFYLYVNVLVFYPRTRAHLQKLHARVEWRTENGSKIALAS